MYFDESITFKENSLPKMIQEDLSQIESAYRKNDEPAFLMCRDNFEIGIKNCFYGKKISRETAERLLQKVGLS